MAQGGKREVAKTKGQWGWAGIWAVLPPSVASRETPQHMCPQEGQETSPERLASSAQPSFPAPRTDVVCESALFSLGHGEDCSEKTGFELSGAQL